MRLRSVSIWILRVALLISVLSLSVTRSSWAADSKEPILIGTETWPGYLPLFVARDKGFFKEEGVTVVLKRYVALGELSKDYVAGKLQGRANLTLEMVNERLQGLDHKAVLAIDYSNGSDAVIARSPVQHIKDCKEKRVAFEPGTLEEFFLAWALQAHELSLNDVVPVYLDPEASATQLRERAVDVAISHEPFLTEALKDPEIHVIYSSAEAPGLITDVLTFRTDIIQQRPDSVRAIIRAYFRGLRFWKEHPDEAHAILALEFGITADEVAEQMKGIRMLDERDNQTAFTFAVGLESLYGNLRQIGKFVKTHQERTETELNTDALIDKQFVKQL